jgi:hypothetical protein
MLSSDQIKELKLLIREYDPDKAPDWSFRRGVIFELLDRLTFHDAPENRDDLVRFGFASFSNRKFELIVINIKTGEEVMLEGQLRPDQTIEQIDKVLPTCVYVTGTPAQAAEVPVAWRWKPRRSRNWIACDKLPEFTDDADVITEALYSGPVAHLSAGNGGEK